MIANRIRAARMRLGLSARALDEKAGLSAGHTALIERGERYRLSAETLRALSVALGVSIDWIVSGEKAA